MSLSSQGTLANCFGVINLNIDKKERTGVGARVTELGDEWNGGKRRQGVQIEGLRICEI